MPKENVKKIICKNCDNKFAGNYCPSCGQSVKDLDRPFMTLILDVLSHMWALDTRLLKTLKSLIFRPGEMAADYVAGKRERYMPPFRIYLFVSIILFLLLNVATNRQFDNGQKNATISEKNEVGKNITVNFVNDLENNTRNTEVNRKLIKKVLDNKDYYISRFFSILSWSLFLLMPLYAFFLWVLFRKRQKYYLAHFIFAINQHTFLFLIFVILLGVNLIFTNKTISPEYFLLVLFPVYIVTGSHKLYNTRWSPAIFKSLFAQIIYIFVIILAIAGVLYVTFYKTFEGLQ